MIGIITKNCVYQKLLTDALKPYNPILTEEPSPQMDLIILSYSQKETEDFFRVFQNHPVILLGSHHDDADIELPLPCQLTELYQCIDKIMDQMKQAPSFENAFFSFQGQYRQILNKQTNEIIHLTEKENNLIIYLVKNQHKIISKEELLTAVWNYRPDTETHTVESHIYTLRQKLGETANQFIQNTTNGYTIVS